MEKPKRKSKNRSLIKNPRFWMWFILADAVSFTIMLIIFLATNVNIDLGLGKEYRYYAEQWLNVGLPEQALNVRAASFTLHDPGAWIRFEIPSELGLDWAAETPCFEHFTRDPSWLFLPSPIEIDWWQPQAADTLLVSRCEADTLYFAYVDQSDPNIWIVYIQIQA